MCDTFCRSVGAMRRREGIVHINIAKFGEGRDKIRLVLFLALMKASVFEQQNLPVFHDRNGALGIRPDAIRREQHDFVQGACQRLQEGRERLRFIAASRAAKMRKQNCFAAFFGDFLDRGECGADAGVVGDFTVLHRHVQIDADEDALSLHVCFVEGSEAHCWFYPTLILRDASLRSAPQDEGLC